MGIGVVSKFCNKFSFVIDEFSVKAFPSSSPSLMTAFPSSSPSLKASTPNATTSWPSTSYLRHTHLMADGHTHFMTDDAANKTLIHKEKTDQRRQSLASLTRSHKLTRERQIGRLLDIGDPQVGLCPTPPRYRGEQRFHRANPSHEGWGNREQEAIDQTASLLLPRCCGRELSTSDDMQGKRCVIL